MASGVVTSVEEAKSAGHAEEERERAQSLTKLLVNGGGRKSDAFQLVNNVFKVCFWHG